MTDWKIRARGVIADYFTVVVAVLLVVALAGGYVTYSTYVNPETHIEERPGESWETTAQFDHAATVSEPNSVYDVGTTLANRSAYFSSISPILEGEFTYGYTASESGDLTVDTRTELVLRSVQRDRNGDIETRYWQVSRELDDQQAQNIAPGESVSVPFAFNVSALDQRSADISEELGGTVGNTESFVRVTVDTAGTVNGESVDDTEVYTLPVDVGNIYTVSNPGAVSETHTSTQQVAVPNEYGPMERLGAPLLLLVSLGALGALFVFERRGSLEPTTTERAYLAYREARQEFDEWINCIALPESAFDLPRAEAASLGDLVDFAIDTNNSVLEDPDDGTYYVVHGGYLYSYTPPEHGQDAGLETHVGAEATAEDPSESETGLLSDSMSEPASDAESTAGASATSE